MICSLYNIIGKFTFSATPPALPRMTGKKGSERVDEWTNDGMSARVTVTMANGLCIEISFRLSFRAIDTHINHFELLLLASSYWIVCQFRGLFSHSLAI